MKIATDLLIVFRVYEIADEKSLVYGDDMFCLGMAYWHGVIAYSLYDAHIVHFFTKKKRNKKRTPLKIKQS